VAIAKIHLITIDFTGTKFAYSFMVAIGFGRLTLAQFHSTLFYRWVRVGTALLD
jgi:hypothetical protein